MNKTTLKDIAEYMGVSITTVHKALTNKGKISEELRQEIMRVADEMNYKPNRVAQSLSRKTIRIACIVPVHPGTFYDYVEQGAQAGAKSLEDYNVTCDIFRTKDNDDSLRVWEQLYLSGYDGIISSFDESSNRGCYELQKKYADREMPIVAITSEPLDKTRIVGMIGTEGGLLGGLAGELASRFVNDTKRTMVVVVPDYASKMHMETADGFIKVCKEFGYNDSYIYTGRYKDEKKVVEKILKEHPDLASVYIGSNNGANVARELKKKKISQDVVIIGNDLYPELADMIKEGTVTAAIFQNQYGNTVRATRSLVDYILGDTPNFETMYYRAQIVMRNTVDFYADLY